MEAKLRPTAASESHTNFHEGALVCGVWLIVVFVGAHTASAMRFVLEPLLWAFFLMMGLLPLTEAIECWIVQAARWLQNSVAVLLGGGTKASSWSRSREGYPGEGHMAALDSELEALSQASDKEDSDEEHQGGDRNRCGLRRLARFLSVLFTVAGLFGLVVMFTAMIFESAEHMQSNWSHYQDGAKRVSTDVNKAMSIISKRAPKEVAQDIAEKTLSGIEDTLQLILTKILSNVTSTLGELVMMALYMIFWLSNPIDVRKEVAVIFKRYILLKGLASALYATCVWVVLHALSIDLAVVFGLITFLFNFVPEVGPFLAAVLPVPVILFDGRLASPWASVGAALCAQLALKFIFGNIVEVKLIESQQDLKMHPVIILFFVAFFAWMWGATGMLLSVPLMAAAKATMHALPAIYRDPILMLLEGDKRAPARYNAWYQNRHTRVTAGGYPPAEP
jgi:AI-2 transport protein TqsA